MAFRYSLAAAGLALLAAATPAGANPIGPPPLSCPNNTCQGSIYELTYSGSPISSTATTQTFEITLSISPSGYTGGGAFIDNVAPKVSSSVSTGSLVSAPGSVGDWTVFLSGINAGGCSMAGSGFVCAGDAPPPNAAPLPFAGTYTWVFDLTIPTGSLLTGANAASIKVRYSDASGHKVGTLVSEPITLEVIPEPSTLLLVGIGLGLVSARRRPAARPR